jgi:hypothetical protein
VANSDYCYVCLSVSCVKPEFILTVLTASVIRRLGGVLLLMYAMLNVVG